MSGSGGMSQLIKGIIIGVVLIMAAIGAMSIFDIDNPLISSTENPTQSGLQTTTNQNTDAIIAPPIKLNPNDANKVNSNPNNTNIGDLNAEIPEENINDQALNEQANPLVEENNTPANKPVLEDERSTEEAAAQSDNTTFGMLQINAINPDNNQPLKATYTVFDQKNTKVAESKNTANASYRLPIGQYKVETTLDRVDEVTNQVIPVVTKSRYIIVRKNTTVKQTFELEPPATTGVLQVSAKINDKLVRANFVIQKANGEVVASRNNVTNSLFKLNTGTYKVSVNSGNNRDFRSVEVKAGESLQTVFTLKLIAQQGKLLVRVFDTRSSTPVRADITIRDAKGSVIQALKASTQTELSLAAGDYKINVAGPNGASNKTIRLNPGQALSEIFRFEAPNTSQRTNQETTQTNPQATQQSPDSNTTVQAPAPNTPQTPANASNVATAPEAPAQAPAANGTAILNVVARDNDTNKLIKSNIYIQTPAGKLLDNKTYVDSASFTLSPGIYKVTVRATNRNNSVRNIRITANNNISETFLMTNPNQTAANAVVKPVAKAPAKVAAPTASASNTPKAIPTGFLSVFMQAPRGVRVAPNALNTHFIVATTAGKKIVELTSVKEGNFKLDVGSYLVTAIHKSKRRNQRVDVRQNQKARVVFNTNDFQAAKGVLRSRIVDQTGRPLKGNLTVSDMSGRVIARANNVTNAAFDLPPVQHAIRVDFQGISGSEVVNISSNETTVQTFTVAPQQQAPANQPKNLQDILKEKIKKEIQRNLQ